MRTLSSQTNDAVRVTLSKDSQDISEKQKQSQNQATDDVVDTEIVTEIDSDQPSESTNVTQENAIDSDHEDKHQKSQENSSSETDSALSEPENDDPEIKLKNKQKELDNVQDRLLRLSAEFENFKKRNRREMSEFKKYASEVLIKDLLPVVDNLDRALEIKNSDDACKAIFEGVSLTRDEMLKTFSKYGVQPIDAIEKPFDPAYHQAVGQEPDDNFPDNTVLKEYQKGYTIHGRLLRPSMVVVSKK